MHLHAITIADIATADRKRISAVAWRCQQGNGLREQILWPGSEEAVPHSWIELWKTALQFSLCQQYLVQNDHMLLDMPLGDWYNKNVAKYICLCILRYTSLCTNMYISATRPRCDVSDFSSKFLAFFYDKLNSKR